MRNFGKITTTVIDVSEIARVACEIAVKQLDEHNRKVGAEGLLNGYLSRYLRPVSIGVDGLFLLAANGDNEVSSAAYEEVKRRVDSSGRSGGDIVPIERSAFIYDPDTSPTIGMIVDAARRAFNLMEIDTRRRVQSHSFSLYCFHPDFPCAVVFHDGRDGNGTISDEPAGLTITPGAEGISSQGYLSFVNGSLPPSATAREVLDMLTEEARSTLNYGGKDGMELNKPAAGGA